jgi:hypothetical protein
MVYGFIPWKTLIQWIAKGKQNNLFSGLENVAGFRI